MEVVQRSIDVPKAADAVGENLASFVMAIDKALEDGWDLSQDLPVILTAAMGNLVPAIQQAKDAGADFNADPYMSAKAISVHAMDIVKALATKESA